MAVTRSGWERDGASNAAASQHLTESAARSSSGSALAMRGAEGEAVVQNIPRVLAIVAGALILADTAGGAVRATLEVRT